MLVNLYVRPLNAAKNTARYILTYIYITLQYRETELIKFFISLKTECLNKGKKLQIPLK